jgi:hypothetical protein
MLDRKLGDIFEKVGQFAFLVGGQMLHDEDRRTNVGRERAQHGIQSLEASCGSANDDNVVSGHIESRNHDDSGSFRAGRDASERRPDFPVLMSPGSTRGRVTVNVDP